MHSPFWRLDIDLDGFAGDSVHQGAHTENLPGLTATDTAPLIPTETGLIWNPLAFTTLEIHDANLRNSRGSPSSDHLMPLPWGTSRHQEAFTKNDLWVTRYKSSEMFAKDLPSYISPPEPVSNSDIVVCYKGAIHHLVRDEDGEFVTLPGGATGWRGEAHVIWTGWLLKPHNLFDRTPLYP